MITTLKLTYEHKDQPKGELTIKGEEKFFNRVMQASMHDILWVMGVREMGGLFKFYLANEKVDTSAHFKTDPGILPCSLGSIVMRGYADSEETESVETVKAWYEGR